MADDTTIAMWTNGRERVDRTLEAIESVTLSIHHDLERLIVFILANFAFRHTQLVRA